MENTKLNKDTTFLRKMTIDDIETLRHNKNKNKKYFFNQEEITYEKQLNWYHYMQETNDNFMFICIDKNNESFGCIGFRKLENVVDVYNVMRFKQSEISMSECMHQVIQEIKKKYSELPIQVLVLKNNPAIDWYKKNGFTLTEQSDNFVKMILEK